MGMMVIYIEDKEDDKVQVNAEYKGEESNAYEIGSMMLQSLLLMEEVSLIKQESNTILACPSSPSIN